MNGPVTAFRVGDLYSSEEIQRSLAVGNAGGVRLSLDDDGNARRMAIMTSVVTVRQLSENPYHDRIEGGTLVYTGAGLEGDQTLGGVNQRIPQQEGELFPIYGFILIGSRRDRTIGPKRWRLLGLLQYLRHYPEIQVDVRLQQRTVWLFELRILGSQQEIPTANDALLAEQMIEDARRAEPDEPGDHEIATPTINVADTTRVDPALIESIRGRLLAVEPQRFEHIVREALVHSGFERVDVTQFSQDGGIDLNAYAGAKMWPMRDLLLQVQAKRWMHTVGRKEVAELRGSLELHAHGAVVTTSHFSRAAIAEAAGAGKRPIVLVDGFTFATILHSSNISI
jgi:HJR/Mrr/RecB family endonuclease